MARLLVALVALGLISPGPAQACSARRSSKTHFEMVADTPVIVLARAIGRSAAGVDFRVARVIKGQVEVGAAFTDPVGVLGPVERPERYDFSRVQPGALSGACRAYRYAPGLHYLLFLDERGGGLSLDGEAFSRVNEEVDVEGEPWVLAVTEYARIAALPDRAEQRRELRELQALGHGACASETDRAISADVAAHLDTPTPGKTFGELLDLWARGLGRGRVLAAVAARGEPQALGFMRARLDDLAAGTLALDGEAVAAIALYFSRVADEPSLALAGELFIRSAGNKARLPLAGLLARRARSEHQPLMERALASCVQAEDVSDLAYWFVRHPSPRARREVSRLLDEAYAERYWLTYALAAMGDPGPLAWARVQLATNSPSRWIALRVIAMAPDGDAIARRIIAAGGPDLPALISGYDVAEHAHVDDRLHQLERMELSIPARQALEIAMHRRDQHRR